LSFNKKSSPVFNSIVSPAVALLAGGTICYELLSNSKIELPPYLAVFHANSWRAIKSKALSPQEMQDFRR
jgi:hypothetical protein